MARLIARANGNFTDSSTWSVVDTTSLLDSDTTFTLLTTSWQESNSFTPGAITIDGIAIKISHRYSTTPSGTMSVRLAQGGSTVPGTEVSINVSDIAPITSSSAPNQIGWYFFKFAEPVTLQAATAYTVSAKTSVSNQVYVKVNTGTNWSRMLRMTTTQAPANNDYLYVLGEWTEPGTYTGRTVSMNDESGIVYYCLDVGAYGKLKFITDESKSLKLYVDGGDSYIRAYGEVTIGTSSDPIPISSTAVMGINAPSGNRYFYVCQYGRLETCGSPRTAGKEVVSCLLTQTANVGATTLYVDTDTGWKAGDTIIISGSTKGTAQVESKTLQYNASEGSLVITTGLAYQKVVGGYEKVEIILLTQNVSLVSNSASYLFYIYGYGELTTKFTRFNRVSYSGQRGSITINKCSAYYFSGTTDNSISSFTFQITDFVVYNLRGAGVYQGVCNIDGFVAIYCDSATSVLDGIHGQSTYKNMRFYNGAITFINLHGSSYNPILESCELRYGSQTGLVIQLSATEYVTTKDILAYKVALGNYVGVDVNGEGTWYGEDISIIGVEGNYAPLRIYGKLLRVYLKNVYIKKLSGTTCSYGIYHSSGDYSSSVYINGLEIDETSGNFDTAQIYLATYYFAKWHIINAVGLDYTRWTISPRYHELINEVPVYIAVDNANNHLFHWVRGTVISDSTIRRGTTGFSQKLIPKSSTAKLKSGVKRVPVNSGAQVTVNVYVRESVSSDGQDYNGNRPRLLVRKNELAGITDDTVLDTATSACEGNWEQLSGTTLQVSCDTILEFYVDCDGTQGWVNVDDWSVG